MSKWLIVGVSPVPGKREKEAMTLLQSFGYEVEYQHGGEINGLAFDYVVIDEQLEGNYEHYQTPV